MSEKKPEKVEGGAVEEEHFNSQTISIKVQKKLASKLPTKKLVKFFIDETSARVFNNLNLLLRAYCGSKREANRLMKTVVKINAKLAILFINGVLSNSDIEILAKSRNAFAKVAQICLNVHKKKSHANLNLDPLIEQFNVCHNSIMVIARNYLTEKSQNKISLCTNFFCNRQFLATVFSNEPRYYELMEKICEDIQELIDRGML